MKLSRTLAARTCKTCVFFAPYEGAEEMIEGSCVRHPPDGRHNPGPDYLTTDFPETYVQWSCGEHRTDAEGIR